MQTLRLALAALLFALTAAVQAADTQLTYLGHSAFKLTLPSGKVLLIDPWVTNPLNKRGAEDLAELDKADLILVTHGHADHVGNAVEIARKTGAKLVASFDLAKAMVGYLGFPKEQAGFDTMGASGGRITLLDGEVTVGFVAALHGSSLEPGEGMPETGLLQSAGTAGGFTVSVKGGPTLYHTGDTDVFSDMALVNRFARVDVLIACIGDKFTMGPERAALATKLVAPRKLVVPMHYGTFPVLTGTPKAFAAALKREGVRAPMREMKVGETLGL